MPRLVLDEPIIEEKKPHLVLDELANEKAGPHLVLDQPSSRRETIPEATSEELGAEPERQKFGKMSPLMKFLDVAGRPGYAVKAAISEFQKQTPKEMSPQEIAAQYPEYAAKGLTPPDELTQRPSERAGSAPAIVQAFWRGLTGRERKRFENLLENEGITMRFPGLGLAGEIATDPLMYGGYSAITKGIGAVAKGASKLAMKVPAIEAGVTKIGEVVEPIRELISTKSPIPKLNEMIDKWLSERHWLKGKEIQYAAQTRLAVRSIARKSSTTPKLVGQRIANIVELGNYPDELAKVVPNIIPEERVLANTLQSHLSNMIVDEMKRGVPISPLSSVRDAKTAKLRKNLEVIRTQYGTELARTRAKLVRELDVYGDAKLVEQTAKLTGAKEKIEDAAYRSHLDNVKRVNGLIDDVDRQMRTLEKLKLKVAKGGTQAISVEQEITKVNTLVDKLQLAEAGGLEGVKGARIPNKSLQGLLNRRTLLEQNLRNLQEQAARPIIDIDKQLSKLENQYWYLHSEMADRLQDIPELAKGSLYMKHIDDISKLLSADIEVNLGAKGTSLAKQIMAAEEKAGKLPMTQIGIPIGESRKLLKTLTIERAKREFGYFPRITTDEARQLLLSMKIGRTKLWTPEMMNALKRRTSDFTIEEFNSFVNSFGLTSLEGKTIQQFFMTDPSYAMAVRGTRGAKAVTSAGFLEDVGKTFGVAAKDAPSNYIQLPDHVIQLNPSLAGKVFPEEVASEIGRATEYYMNPVYRPDIWGKFAKHFDQVQNVWKRWQLAVFPKYHLRNMVGNVWNNYLADVDPQYYIKAQALQSYRKYRHVPFAGDLARKKLRTLGIGLDDAEKMILSAEKLGVLESGWYAADIDLSIRQALGKGGISGRGMKVGRTIENNARLAHFLDRTVGRGKSVEEAALSVKKYLFDYADLTHFERNAMKRIMPFYTWTRKNIPLQLESLWKTPEKFAPIAVPIRNREPLDLLRLKYTNPNLYNNLPIELQRTIDTVTYVPLEGLLPAADLSKMGTPEDMAKTVWGLFSPFIKEPIEQLFNKDIYSGRQIQSSLSETQPFLGVEVPVRIRHLLSTVAPSARITRELDKVVTKRKNKIPLTAAEWAVASTLSTVYKTNLEDLRRRAISRIVGQLRELQISASQAKRNGREEAFQMIKKTMKEVIDDMRGIK